MVAKHSIFICYSHADEQYQRAVASHLQVLSHSQADVSVWSDERIAAGDDWFPEIVKAINAASVAVLLVSADFLQSAFVTREEVPRLLQRRASEGLHVIPIIVRNVAIKRVPWLAGIEWRPKGKPLSALNRNDREAALAKITEEIAGFLEGKTGTSSTRPSSSKATAPAIGTKIALVDLTQRWDLWDGCWVKISENGFAFMMRFFRDGGLLESSLFDTTKIWPGEWKLVSQKTVVVTIKTDATYLMRFKFERLPQTGTTEMLDAHETNSASGPSVTTRFKLIHIPSSHSGDLN